MAAEVACGSFVADTAGGTQAITGLGFAPKFVWLFANLATARGWGLTNSCAFSMLGLYAPISAASNNNCQGNIAQDNVNPSNIATTSSQLRCIQMLSDGAGTVDAIATGAGTSSDGFSVQWNDAPSSGWLINYLAIGGADLLSAYLAALTLTTAAGNQASTAPGFPPDLVGFHYVNFGGGGGIGYASGAAPAQATLYSHDRDAVNPTDQLARFSPSNVLGGMRLAGAPATLQLDFLASLVSLDALGYTLNKSDTPAANRIVPIVALRGSDAVCGVTTVPVATGEQVLPGTEDAGGVLLFSRCKANGDLSNDLFTSIGAAAGSNQRCIFYGSTKGASPSVVDQYSSDTQALVAGVTLATQTLTSVAELVSFGAAGVTLNWTAVSGNQEEFCYIAMGGARRRQHLLSILGVGT